MPWVVGIDEAGYGPNLGPLAQAAVALKLPETDLAGWDALAAHIYRSGVRVPKTDARVMVDDSKLVNTGKNGLAKLERGVASLLGVPPGPFAGWLGQIALHHVLEDLTAEFWFDGTDPVPLHADPVPDHRPGLVERGLDARIIAASLVPAPIFNRIVSGSGSKATVLTIGLTRLLTAIRAALPDRDPIVVVCDKQGGRNLYAPYLRDAFHDGWVVTELETPTEGRYRIDSLDREITIIFRPGADAGSASVALASMLSKYLREVCMRQFNRFWSNHVPDLKPTAGYPVDAKRYYEAIRPAMEKLGISEEAVWRMK
ncbi:hypothetical protein [Fimbriiglobus ruber]|uniref:Ribonuclease HII n=1 Tax=Fimbriiglobus ruber TaxID=1908690 RepID=A0A225E9J6_9BACT|nr:hypothetical protein [Fimbriiglobus ruber]OWK47408.1 Ribonuclease HII [Fimbriiglobus ruber]